MHEEVQALCFEWHPESGACAISLRIFAEIQAEDLTFSSGSS